MDSEARRLTGNSSTTWRDFQRTCDLIAGRREPAAGNTLGGFTEIGLAFLFGHIGSHRLRLLELFLTRIIECVQSDPSWTVERELRALVPVATQLMLDYVELRGEERTAAECWITELLTPTYKTEE